MQSLQAGGIMLYEVATPDVGLASAGYASRAGDASTVFTNPAGMSRLDGAQIAGGLQALYGSVTFSPDQHTSARLGDGDGGNAVGWLPAGSAFVVLPLGEKWRAGLGAFSYFGLAEKYDEDWVGRYYAQESALLGLTLMPSVSYEVNSWLSVGAGLNAMYGYLDTDLAVNNGLGPDGQMSLLDRTWGFGANLGVLVKLAESSRLGLTWLSALELDFRDTPTFTGLGPGLGAILANPGELDLGATVPQTAMLSFHQGLGQRWALMADLGWQDWSEFGYVQAGVESGGATTLSLDFQDTWHGALGAQYRASDQWLLSAGVAYDSSAVEDEHRTVALPMGETWRFGLGAQLQLSRALTVGAAGTFLWLGDMAVDQGHALALRGRVSGAFEDSWFAIAALTLDWKL